MCLLMLGPECVPMTSFHALNHLRAEGASISVSQGLRLGEGRDLTPSAGMEGARTHTQDLDTQICPFALGVKQRQWWEMCLGQTIQVCHL